MTVQCARCHAHKFDPISQRDYYALQTIFLPALDPARWQPSGVRGMVQAFLLIPGLVAVFAAAPDCACAATNVGAHRIAAITTARAPNEKQNRFLI